MPSPRIPTSGMPNQNVPPLVSRLLPDYHRFFLKSCFSTVGTTAVQACATGTVWKRLFIFWEFAMRHVLSALVQNVPGVLSHISGMLASRGYNIDSLAVGETEDPQLSRMTFVVVGGDSVLEQVRKQLEKIVTVVRVDDIGSADHVERDLMLIKVSAPAGRRAEISQLTEIFRGRIVDVGPETMIIEIAGQEGKVEAFIEMVRPFGIIELARTGRIAMVRGKGDGKPSLPVDSP